jgi:hypothetical protein
MAKSLGLTGLLLLALAGLAAAEGAGTTAMEMKSYVYIKQDGSLYVGEGVADLKEFGGDFARAVVAAKERARLDLASGIRVEVSGETSEIQEASGSQVREDIKSSSSSRVLLNLENVKYMEFKSLPEQGQVTVLASLSKEDYRRQLAGKAVPVYAPENGLELSYGPGGFGEGNWLVGRGNESYLGVDVLFRSFVLGLENGSGVLRFPNAVMDNSELTVSLWNLEFGYDWTPWHWRFQPYVPLRILAENVGIKELSSGTNVAGAEAGLGFRYWPTDSLAVDLNVRYDQGFNQRELIGKNGAPVFDTDSRTNVLASTTGVGIRLGLMWSGF